VLDRELARLPAKYREVIVLCDLEGEGRTEVARRLGCPEGTVASRLARARTLLAGRLTRRGVALSGGTLVVVLCEKAGASCVPASLVLATVKAATFFVAGPGGATGAISTHVTALTQGVLKAMLLSKLKTATALLAVLLVLGMAALTGVLLAGGQAGGKEDEVRKPAAEGADKAADKPAAYVQIETKGKLIRQEKGYAVRAKDAVFPDVEVLVRLQRSEDKDRALDEHLKPLEGKVVVVTGFLDCRRLDGDKPVLALHLRQQEQVKAAEGK
jgi:hypothetical protein